MILLANLKTTQILGSIIISHQSRNTRFNNRERTGRYPTCQILDTNFHDIPPHTNISSITTSTIHTNSSRHHPINICRYQSKRG
ncbi:hypothetical protein Hanom_Chr14g01277921 [Helianthus anomalus]